MKIGITFGDVSGIGVEVILKALAHPRLIAMASDVEFVLFGNPSVFEENLRILKAPPLKVPISFHEPQKKAPSSLSFKVSDFGKCLEQHGAFSVHWIEEAVRSCAEGHLHALVTAPIHKEACRKSGFLYAGHTDFLGELLGVSNPKMMFLSPKMKVLLVTHHQSLQSVPSSLTQKLIFETILEGDRAMKALGFPKPKIRVCGLNPHAGEANAFGEEDQTFILPAIKKAQAANLFVSGPHSADALFYHIKEDAELVISMYHDQGLIPFKLLAFDSGVHLTINIPIIRTSPCHGTAFDIAGKGLANETSMLEAILGSIRMASHRTP